jgi:hypothetical protein
MSPETYDQLLSLLLRAAAEARKEAQVLVMRVFEDAASAAAQIAGELRKIEEYERTHKTRLLNIEEVVAWLEDEGELEAFLEADRRPESARPHELGLCMVCSERFSPGESAVRAPAFDQIGFAHLECLSVVIVDERP